MVVCGRYLLPLEYRIFIHVYSRGRGVVQVSFRVPWSVLDDHGADAGACVRAVACHDPLGILGVKTAVFL